VQDLVVLARTVDRSPGLDEPHCDRVAGLAEALAIAAGCDAARAERIHLAGLLHDVGKVFVPRGIVDKPGPLTTSEATQMARHPQLGADLITDPELEDVRRWVLTHHERVDGGGYPLGLAPPDLSLEAQIIAIADAYEVMTNDRPYRMRRSYDQACGELVAGAGSHFDAKLVALFLANVASSLAY
jgi:HD-GYP domain-containing protein (c-di-GMP phosphodiesterase class II)